MHLFFHATAPLTQTRPDRCQKSILSGGNCTLTGPGVSELMETPGRESKKNSSPEHLKTFLFYFIFLEYVFFSPQFNVFWHCACPAWTVFGRKICKEQFGVVSGKENFFPRNSSWVSMVAWQQHYRVHYSDQVLRAAAFIQKSNFTIYRTVFLITGFSLSDRVPRTSQDMFWTFHFSPLLLLKLTVVEMWWNGLIVCLMDYFRNGNNVQGMILPCGQCWIDLNYHSCFLFVLLILIADAEQPNYFLLVSYQICLLHYYVHGNTTHII